MKKQRTLLMIMLLMLSFIGSIALPSAFAQEEPVLTVAVSISPLGGIVENIGDNYVTVLTLLPEGVEPHATQLPQSAINAANDADFLVLTGHFEWEEDLASQVTTPYITLEDFEDYGARFSELPDGDENPHAYWLLPSNAIAIANATRASFNSLYGALSDFWQSSFEAFVADVEAFEDLVQTSDEEYSFSNLHAVVVFPAEAYVAEAFGIEVDAVLSEGDDVFISGNDLLQVQQALNNGSIDLILGSDVARLQAGGEFATQLAQDTESNLIWWRAIFFSGLSDYIAIMTFNLGALTTGLEQDVGVQTESLVVTGLTILSAALSVIVIVEAVLLYRRIKGE